MNITDLSWHALAGMKTLSCSTVTFYAVHLALKRESVTNASLIMLFNSDSGHVDYLQDQSLIVFLTIIHVK